jgi:hypothetical protein
MTSHPGNGRLPTMARKVLGLTLMAVLLGVVGTAALGEDKTDLVANPLYKAWANARPGTVVKRKETVKYAPGTPESRNYPDGVDWKEVTYTVKQVTKDKVVVQVVVLEPELLSTVESAPTRITFPAKVTEAEYAAAKEKLKPEESEEEVTFKGKTFKGKKIKITRMGDGTVTEETILASDEIPGGMVSKTSVTKKGKEVVHEATIKLLDFTVPAPPKKDKEKDKGKDKDKKPD